MMNKKAVILLSGGLDSTTCCAIAKKQGYDMFAMSFRYGQRHDIELDAAKRIAAQFEVKEHKIVDIDLAVFGGSSLTADIDVPKGIVESNNIPNTYVPARNTIFLSYALAWAEVLNSFNIYIGVNAVDYSGYPDCRPKFIEAYNKMANLATKNGVEGRTLSIHTPLISLTKADIIKLGITLGVDYGVTHSCYDPDLNGLACGECDSCRLRKKGFLEADIPDPTRYN